MPPRMPRRYADAGIRVERRRLRARIGRHRLPEALRRAYRLVRVLRCSCDSPDQRLIVR
ncbi:hypothetical protein C7S16_0706 [Burkholderia thailandensis]|uniref:Uncharacterized protein n=1 Tax=Burkholderia thailandensis TaxID=57975 RepID=A0AAW9CXK4_BURTH|nr:hypothetical protein [Burkholderia thailandensis]